MKPAEDAVPVGGQVMFIDDDRYIRESTRQLMEIEGIGITCYPSAVAALEHIDPDCCGVIISDIKMPRMTGLELLQAALRIDPDIPVILITAQGDIAMAVQAMRDGAYHFLEKPFSNDTLVELTRRALERRALTLENRNLKLELSLQDTPGQRIIGRTVAIRRLRSTVARLAVTDADLLLVGETGSGKDVVARMIHERSARSQHQFVAINCGAIPESIIESELFGHHAGAFTGADRRRIGKFEHAQGGTVFLDEIESMPLQSQVRLLRVLQERVVEPLGDNRQVALDVRVIAATKTQLTDEIEAGRFRADLYYRLNVLTLAIPPLRERLEDVPLLFQHYLLIAANRHGCEVPRPSPEQMQELLAHDWPGNVRELKNVAERFVLMGESAAILGVDDPTERENRGMTLPEQMDWFEKNAIEQALITSRGGISGAMDLLGLPRKTLYDKMRKHQLDKDDYKP